jgi:hypothetical protein
MWQGLFFLILSCNLYLGYDFINKFFDYTCLYPVSQTKIEHFEVLPGPEGSFFLKAAFDVGGALTSYQFKENFINEFVAEETMESMRQVEWTIYKNSYTNAFELQKYFPMKELVHLGLCVAVTLYFCWLYVYARRFNYKK